MLDLTRITTRDEALAMAAAGCPTEYTGIAKEVLGTDVALTPGSLLYMSMISRVRGLHEAVVRELAEDNPHAVLPLCRAWVELLTIINYCIKKPAYIDVLVSPLVGPRAGARKKFGAMFHALRDQFAGLEQVYRQLSEYSHFGPSAVWNAHSIDDEAQRTTVWSDAPRFRDDKHFMIACAQAEELAEATFDHSGRSAG